ncbi:hypothetical protein KEM54_006004 [Ascosphaera aggregata]|nr:hypothetical protein KEM54_006004 [Ascosphaera aggregata]
MQEPSPSRHRRSPSLNIPLPVGGPESFRAITAERGKRFTYPWKPAPGHDDHVAQGGIPVGAILSPTDSRNNSSEEDDRDSTGVKSPEISSPTPTGLEFSAAVRERLGTRCVVPQSPPESPQANRLLKSCLRSSGTAPQTPEESDTECDTKITKMVRKKSGELVRPALRAKKRPASVPGTPTYIKAVHFDANLEHIRHFLQVDKPTAVSADTSPVDYYDGDSEFPFGSENRSDDDSDKAEPPTRLQPGFEWDARIANFPAYPEGRKDMVVRLDRIFLTPDNKTLVGVVSVANLAYHKSVVARFTFDYWKTTSEVVAEYNPDVRRKKKQTCNGVEYDRFDFSISLADQANLQSRQLFVCIRYCVGGEEHWDNNNRMNYNINFTRRYNKHGERLQAERHSIGAPRSKRSVSSSASSTSTPPGWSDFSTTDLNSTNNSNGATKTSATAPHCSKPSPLFLKTYSFESSERKTVHVDAIEGLISPSSSGTLSPPVPERSIKLETRTTGDASDDEVTAGPARRGTAKAFASRYDFGASLSAAMQPATNDKQETADNNGSSLTMPSLVFDTSETRNGQTISEQNTKETSASSIENDKPYHQSALYKELVDRYCFYGSQKPTSTSQATDTPAAPRGSQHRASDLGVGSGPAMPVSPYLNNLWISKSMSTNPASSTVAASRGGSPSTSLHPLRAASPVYANRGVSPISRTPSPFSPNATPSPPLTASAAHSPSFASIFGDEHPNNMVLPFALPRPLLSNSSSPQTAIQG